MFRMKNNWHMVIYSARGTDSRQFGILCNDTEHILTRAGLSLKFSDLKKVDCPAINFRTTFCCCDDFSTIYSFKKECALMGREIYDIVNDMAEVLNASQMQRLQEVLIKRVGVARSNDTSKRYTSGLRFIKESLYVGCKKNCMKWFSQ